MRIFAHRLYCFCHQSRSKGSSPTLPTSCPRAGPPASLTVPLATEWVVGRPSALTGRPSQPAGSAAFFPLPNWRPRRRPRGVRGPAAAQLAVSRRRTSQQRTQNPAQPPPPPKPRSPQGRSREGGLGTRTVVDPTVSWPRSPAGPAGGLPSRAAGPPPSVWYPSQASGGGGRPGCASPLPRVFDLPHPRPPVQPYRFWCLCPQSHTGAVA